MAEKRYAILIASSSYPDEPGLTDLRCPANDVDALDKVLRSPDLGGFTETDVFKNRPSHEVLERIETVLGEAGREDLVLREPEENNHPGYYLSDRHPVEHPGQLDKYYFPLPLSIFPGTGS